MICCVIGIAWLSDGFFGLQGIPDTESLNGEIETGEGPGFRDPMKKQYRRVNM